MSASRRVVPRTIAVLALALALGTRPAQGADLGPHGKLSTDPRGCTACHLSPTSRGLDIGRLRGIDVPKGGKARLADPMSRFCWICHRAGNPYGARPIEGRALEATGHGAIPGRATTPDAWAVGQPVVDPFTRSGIHKSGMGYLSCTTCHDVHDGAAPLFLRKSQGTKEDTELCAACHPGRENAGLTGIRNIVVRDRSAYSTHPALRSGAVPGSGDAIPRCLDCHDVHRAAPPGEKPVPGLLRLGPGETTSDLCRRCHAFPGASDRETHPMEARSAGRIPPAAFATPQGLPREWGEQQHFDRGASEVPRGEAPRCTSCHDLHGGLPMTSLLYGPETGQRRGGDWCFSCHSKEALLRLGHAGADPGGDCARCHGAPAAGSPARWEAHRGFRAVRPAAASSAIDAGSTVPALDAAAVKGLVEALQAQEPAARNQAFEILTKMRPPLEPGVLRTASGDPRPEVRMRTAEVIGALGDRQGGEVLLALVADPDAKVRAAAATALLRTGDPRAADALLPLLADPAPEVRHVAVEAFGVLRDLRAVPGLVALLGDPDWPAVQDALAKYNDARVLDALVPEGSRPAAAAHLVAVLDEISDQAALEDILTLLRHENRLVREAAARALGRYPRPGVAEALSAVLSDGIGAAAATSLIQIGDPRAASFLARSLADPAAHPSVRRAMAAGLARIATPQVVAPLIAALTDGDAGVREEANAALAHLTCRNFGADQDLWRQWWGAQPPSFPLGNCE